MKHFHIVGGKLVPKKPVITTEKYNLLNATAYTKHIIGMTVDKLPHSEIRKGLWRLLEMLRGTNAFKREQDEHRRKPRPA